MACPRSVLRTGPRKKDSRGFLSFAATPSSAMKRRVVFNEQVYIQEIVDIRDKSMHWNPKIDYAPTSPASTPLPESPAPSNMVCPLYLLINYGLADALSSGYTPGFWSGAAGCITSQGSTSADFNTRFRGTKSYSGSSTPFGLSIPSLASTCPYQSCRCQYTSTSHPLFQVSTFRSVIQRFFDSATSFWRPGIFRRYSCLQKDRYIVECIQTINGCKPPPSNMFSFADMTRIFVGATRIRYGPNAFPFGNSSLSLENSAMESN